MPVDDQRVDAELMQPRGDPKSGLPAADDDDCGIVIGIGARPGAAVAPVLGAEVARRVGLGAAPEFLFVASQFVQAMLSLVWSITALLLMRHAAQHQRRGQWSLGAVLLVLVVLKLFLVDLSNVGGIARIVSFVGVGLLMVLIGYLAPFPKAEPVTEPTPENA